MGKDSRAFHPLHPSPVVSMPYTQLTHDDRVSFALLRRMGHSLRSIGRELGKHHTTLGREIQRNQKKNKSGYDARRARQLVHDRRTYAHRRRRKLMNIPWLRCYVIRKLKLYWSPEQIAGRLRARHKRTIICHETIYDWIYEERPDLKQYLRSQKGKYRRRHGSNRRKRMREMEEKKRRVDARPQIIEERKRIGDWEGDTVVGKEKTERILTHVERKSGLLLADKVEKARAELVRTITVERFKTLPASKRRSVTYDNGTEFSEYELIERDANITVYHAYSYRSWERGTNENTNGLLRQFFPKGSSFRNITQENVDHAVSLINNRPRKRHNYRTPLEVFNRKKWCTSR